MNPINFTTKSGRLATVRYMNIGDVAIATEFINIASSEDTYITFSGEQLTEEEERVYLTDCTRRIEAGNFVKLFCFIDGVLVGDCTVGRNLNTKKRGYHTGTLGLIVRNEYRNDGVGESLMRFAIEEAWSKIKGLQIIELYYLAGNVAAQKLYEKMGFTECGRLPRGMWYRGEYIDHVHMFLTKETHI